METEAQYVGTPKSVVAPVFELVCRLRFEEPSADSIIRQTKTQLDHAIVSALIDAATRLLPFDDTPLTVEARQEKQKRRAARAELAEEAFITNFTRLGYRYLSEVQQNVRTQVSNKVTPRHGNSVRSPLYRVRMPSTPRTRDF